MDELIKFEQELDIKKQIIINIEAKPAIRSNRNSWCTSVKNYHNYMNVLRLLIWNKCDKIIQALIQWNYALCYIMPIPKSWPPKKKLEMDWKPHQQTPDLDNLYKAFVDTVFYKNWANDCQIFKIGKSIKMWWESWKIIFYILN